MKLLFATTNPHKLCEAQLILAQYGVEVSGVSVPSASPDETGLTFEENARTKALWYKKYTGELCLAEDSGLEVDALSEAPGVYSARYAGEHRSSDENVAKLLEALQDVPLEKRTARYVCAVSLGDITTRGEIRGHISLAPRGVSAFGYDSVFVPQGHGLTFGESTYIKNSISHRARALGALIQLLRVIKCL